MAEAPARRGRGFSLLELVIVVVIVGILMVAAIDRMARLRYEAERASVQSILAALRSALYIEFAAAATRGEDPAMAAAAGSNPMLRLAQPPDTYAGEFPGADPARFAPGTWYYDSRERALVYVVRFPERFRTRLAGVPRARFRVVPDFEDRDGNDRLDPGEPVRGLDLAPLEGSSFVIFAND